MCMIKTQTAFLHINPGAVKDHQQVLVGIIGRTTCIFNKFGYGSRETKLQYEQADTQQ